MKTQKLFSYMRSFIMFSMLIVIGLMAFDVISMNDVIEFITPSGVGIAMAVGAAQAVEGKPITTADTIAGASELLDHEVSQRITKMKPSQNPLDTLLRNVGKAQSARSWKYEFYKTDMRGVEDEIATGFDTSASATFDSGNMVHTITIAFPHIWSVDDNILVQGVDGGDDDDLVLHIVAKNAANFSLDVIAVNGVGDDEDEIPDLPEGTKLTRIGPAKSELDAQTAPYQIIPVKAFNYNQIHMCQVEESIYQALHKKEVPLNFADHKLAGLYDYRRSCEFTSWFGPRALKTDPIGEDEKYFSGGITRYITKGDSYVSGNITNSVWNGWMKSIFTGNAGSDRRYMFVGKNLMEELNNVDTVVKQMGAMKTETVYGVTFRKIESNFGTLLVKLHNLFEYCGWSAKAAVLDMNHIEMFRFREMSTRTLQLKSSGQRNVNAQLIEEAFGVALRYPDTHCIIGPTAASGS